jgi:hypothetical protein
MPSFPTFQNGIISAQPYGESEVFPVTQSYMQSGHTYTQAWNNGAAQKQILVHFDFMSRAEMNTLETFWASVGGQAGSFSITDDNGVVHANCRFDQPNVDFLYQQPFAYGIDVKILALD